MVGNALLMKGLEDSYLTKKRQKQKLHQEMDASRWRHTRNHHLYLTLVSHAHQAPLPQGKEPFIPHDVLDSARNAGNASVARTECGLR